MHSELSRTPYGHKVTHKVGDDTIWTEYLHLSRAKERPWVSLAVLILLIECLLRIWPASV